MPTSPSKRMPRKRRISIDGDQNGELGAIAAPSKSLTTTSPATTPRKVVKRVRFSDLGPELASTGLTPFVRRSTLSPSIRKLSDDSATPLQDRRHSLPPNLPSCSTPWDKSNIEEIQFTPLRQAIDPRMRRRLRRSHLSEEVNQFEADQRQFTRAQSELYQLRTQAETREDTVKQLMLDLELQRLFNLGVNEEEEQRIRQLESELATWKARGDAVKQEDTDLDNAMDLPSDEIACMDDDDDDDDVTIPDSPWQEETFFSSPTTRRVMDMSSPTPTNKNQTTSNAACQASFSDPTLEAQIKAFEQAVKRLTKENSDAKSALEVIKSELQSMGFAPGDAIDKDVISALKEAFRATRLQLERLVPGETAGGTEHGKALLNAMLDHVKKLVTKAQNDAKTINRQQQIESALRGQFNATVQKVADLEQRLSIVDSHRTDLIRDIESKEEELEEARQEIEAQVIQVKKSEKHIAHLEGEAEEHSTSMDRLQAALATYREEVASLETLVTEMETSNIEKDSQLKDLKSQLEVAVDENHNSNFALSKLRRDVQESAFELSALATPELKENVTTRRHSRRNKRTRSSYNNGFQAIPEEDSRSDEAGSKESSAENQRKSVGSKRDSGVVMDDEDWAAMTPWQLPSME